MANCLYYCFELLLLKYFCAAKFQPEANVRIQVTHRNEEHVCILPPLLASPNFSYVKIILVLIFKDTEIKVFF